MIANLLNTMLGLGLVYCAILAPGFLHGRSWLLIAAGIVISGLALWAHRSDELKWSSLMNALLGAALVVLGIARAILDVHPLVMFWWVFWVGIIVSVAALWSALYSRNERMARDY